MTQSSSIQRKQLNNEENNPCFKEHKLSLKCLSDYNYDKDECKKYFDNYNVCKRFWGEVQRQRRYEGKRPYLPDAEERKVIKEKFLATGVLPWFHHSKN